MFGKMLGSTNIQKYTVLDVFDLSLGDSTEQPLDLPQIN